jgi:ATP-binding cassette subfamily C protein CydD
MRDDPHDTMAADRLEHIDRAASDALRLVGLLETAAGALWPVQALAIAYAVSGWASGAPEGTAMAAGIFAATGVLRALLSARAGAVAFRAADEAVAAERQGLIERESHRIERSESSAAIAALAVDKLPLLVPYLTRYRPAMTRARILPLLFVGLSASVSWAAALILLVAGPLIPLFMALVGMAAREASDRQMQEIGDLNAMLIDRLAALGDLRLLDATARAERDFAAKADGLRQRTMAVLRVAFLSSTVLELFSALGVAMVAVYVGFSLLGEIGFGAWATPLTLAEGVFLLLLAPEFFQPLRDVSAAWHDRASARSVADEIAGLEAAPGEAILGAGGAAAPLPGPATLETIAAEVQRADRRVRLPDLKLAPGETLVLTGPSGAGKSTFLAAAAGLLPLASGEVRVAGAPLAPETADAWRARIAWVPQTVHFRDVTLREFLSESGGGDLDAALRGAMAHGIVARLPGGLEARLGETGAGVSGGEARRLLLARALVSGADLVLADEPTADLDAETAGDVISALRRLADRGAAVLVASHDPAVRAAFGRSVAVGQE